MAFGHLLDTYWASRVATWAAMGPSRCASVGLVHLGGMDTAITAHDTIEPVLTLSELAAHLSVSPCLQLVHARREPATRRGPDDEAA